MAVTASEILGLTLSWAALVSVVEAESDSEAGKMAEADGVSVATGFSLTLQG